MAFLVKNVNRARSAGGTSTTQAIIDQAIHVTRAAASLPATTSQNIFQVVGGKVLVRALYGTVTTVFQAQANTVKVTGTAKSVANVTVGTAVDIATAVDMNALEVGGMIVVGGDGGAILKNNAGAAALGTKIGFWIMPQGVISYTTSATSTGAMSWDIFYQPLDEGAYVVAL